MKRHRCSATIALLIISIAAPAAFGEDYFIYAPRPVAETEKRNLQIGKEEVLVREVLVRKGDTLSKLSRKYSGRGSYYPQILLFNEINNPNLIYAGASLKVPVNALQRDAEAVRPVTPEKGVEGEVKKDSLTPTSQRRVATGSKTQKSGRKKQGSEKSCR
jgi:LysM domain.